MLILLLVTFRLWCNHFMANKAFQTVKMYVCVRRKRWPGAAQTVPTWQLTCVRGRREEGKEAQPVGVEDVSRGELSWSVRTTDDVVDETDASSTPFARLSLVRAGSRARHGPALAPSLASARAGAVVTASGRAGGPSTGRKPRHADVAAVMSSSSIDQHKFVARGDDADDADGRRQRRPTTTIFCAACVKFRVHGLSYVD